MTAAPSNTPRRGRPRAAKAASHEQVIEAVQSLLAERPFRELTMDAVAKRTGVGKPTLYRWWPTRNALVLAMVGERLPWAGEALPHTCAEQKLRSRVQRTVAQYNGVFGKVMAGLIGEAQTDSQLRHDIYETQIRPRRAATIAEIESGKATGEFRADLDAGLLVDAIFGGIYYRLLLGSEPLTAAFGDALVDQVLQGARSADQ